jgi:50S ribosomal protein L16 3-hydroxylase
LRFEDPDLIAQENTGEITAQALEKIQLILRKYTEDKELISQWFGRFVTTPKYQQADPLESDNSDNTYSTEDLKSHLASGGILFRNESSRFAFEVKADENILFVDGYSIDNINDIDELIETLCTEIELSDESFVQTDDNLNLLIELLKRGAIYLAES